MAKAFAACPWPVVGAINGFAITGGFELALMCDVLLASTEAKFADTHSKYSLTPVWGMSQRLPRRVGVAKAREMMLTSRTYSGREAETMGLANSCFADAAFEAGFQEPSRCPIPNAHSAPVESPSISLSPPHPGIAACDRKN